LSEPALFQNLSQLPEALAEAGYPAAPYRPVVERVQRYFRRYAALERALIGDVDVSFPSYLLGLDLPEDPLAAGEQLAALERERLGMGDAEAADLSERLDREGLKLYFPPLPPEGDLAGIFLFDAESGPCFVADGSAGRAGIDHTLALLLHAFLTENDPYRIRLVPRRGDPGGETGLRARAFAAAFLVGADGVAAYLQAAGTAGTERIEPGLVHQLAVFCETGYEPLIARLLAMGRITAGEVPGLLTVLAAEYPLDPVPREGGPVSERYLRLALESHARGDMDLDDLARALETDRGRAARLAGRFRLEPPEEA